MNWVMNAGRQQQQHNDGDDDDDDDIINNIKQFQICTEK